MSAPHTTAATTAAATTTTTTKKKNPLSLHRIELSRVPVISQNPQVENGNDTT